MFALALFYRLIIRPMWREKTRMLLTIFAVALGVSVVLAIELAGNAAAGSFQSSMETLTGDADFEVTAVGGVPDKVVGILSQLPYALRITARIEDHAQVSATGETVPLIGIDLVGESNGLRNEGYASSVSDPLQQIDDPDSIWISRDSGYRLGDNLRLLVNDRERDYIVRGFVSKAANRSRTGDFIVMDIAAAQLATGKSGRVDRILLKLPATPAFGLDQWRDKLRTVLPEGVQISPQGSRTDANRRMLAAFRWNLQILSYVALVVGAFLIYNTISVSVVRRRHEIGIVRALGTDRRSVLAAFLGEAACLGIAGSLIALPLGRLMAQGAVRLLATTVDELYVSSRPGSLELTAGSIVFAFVVGIGVAIASALSPAREASLVSPVEAMARGQREYSVRVRRARDLWIAAALGIAGALASFAPAVANKPLFGYLSALLLIAASAMATPSLVYALSLAAAPLLRRLLGVEAMLASRSLAASLRRTAVLVGALATAIAMMTSVGIMVGSFRQTVVTWMDSELPADLYMRPAGDPAADRHPLISLDLTNRVEKLTGVAGVDRIRAYDIEYQGLPATLASGDTRLTRYYQTSEFLSQRPPDQVLSELRSGDNALVSEPFANKHHVKAGDIITLPLGDRQRRFKVVDLYYDYASESGYIILDRATMLRYLPDPAASNLAVYLAPGADIETVRREIEYAASGSDVLIFSNRDLRREAIRVFDQTFAITYALEAIAIVVAVMGIAGALLSIVIDRRREFGLLRFIGAAKGQLRKLILVEAGLIGILANIAGLVLGVALSLVLIFVINKQSFGWTIQFHWPVAILLGALSLVYVATVLAGLYPARIAQRLNPIEVVHEE